MLQINEKMRQALGLFSCAILFSDARHNSLAYVLPKFVKNHAYTLYNPRRVQKERFWSDWHVFLGKSLTNGIKRYAQPSSIHLPGTGGQCAHTRNLFAGNRPT
jgi:hypothetical protein